MSEEDAREWLATHLDVPRETLLRLERFVALLIEASATQNLVSGATIAQVWNRHILDSAQLLTLAPIAGNWLDVGSGAGFPGLIVAALSDFRTTLVEPRKRRIEFLAKAIEALDIASNTYLAPTRLEAVPTARFGVISARAFAPLERILEVAVRFAGPETRWILPKGRGAKAELDAASRTWQGRFQIVPSVTDPDSGIIVAEGVRAKR